MPHHTITGPAQPAFFCWCAGGGGCRQLQLQGQRQLQGQARPAERHHQRPAQPARTGVLMLLLGAVGWCSSVSESVSESCVSVSLAGLDAVCCASVLVPTALPHEPTAPALPAVVSLSCIDLGTV